MRKKYREMVSEKRRKELYEKAMKMYEEKNKKKEEMGMLLPVETKNMYENMSDEEFDKELEKIERKYQESIKGSTVVMIMR